MNNLKKVIIYDSEQHNHGGDTPYHAWSFTLFPVSVYLNNELEPEKPSFVKPLYKDALTVVIEEVAHEYGQMCKKPPKGRFLKVKTWDEAVEHFRDFIAIHEPDSFYAHNLETDFNTLKNTQQEFGTRSIMKSHIGNLDKLFNIKSWEKMEKLCSAYIFNKDVSPKFTRRVKHHCSFVHKTKKLEELGVNVTRLARGLPVGSDLEYMDELTLVRAMEGRTSV